jgi:hypothetical protein
MLEDEMSNPQEIGQKVQDQTLDTVRKAQDAVVEAVTAWTETANQAPTSDDFPKQFPTVAEVIDSNFAFAQWILSNQREFAHRIIAATAPKTVEAPKAKAATPKAVEAPAAAKKSAPAKTSAAAKKASAARQPGTAATN